MKILLEDLNIKLDETTMLVPAHPSMAREVFELTDRNRASLAEWLPWLPFTQQSGDTEGYLTNKWKQLENGESFDLAIISDNKVVGMVGVHPIDWTNKSTSIGYWLGTEGQGRGIVTRACRVLLNYLFTKLELHRVEIRCATGNRMSRAIPERLGLPHEATLKDAELVGGRFLDSEIYRALAPEWASFKE